MSTESVSKESLSSIYFSDTERDANELPATKIAEGVALFKKNGYLRVENVFNPTLMAAWDKHYQQRYEFQLAKTNQKDKRPLFTVDIEGPFNSPELYANSKIFPIIRAMLGDQCILGAMSTVISFPGAPDQFVHRDSQAIFNDDYAIDTKIPTYAMTMLVPLVDCTLETGCTKVRPGTHLLNSYEESKQSEWVDPEVKVGSLLLTDSRVIHRGGANNSNIIRPLIYLTYHRKWYRDFWGYENRPPVNISSSELKKMPKENRNLVEWIKDPYSQYRIRNSLALAMPKSMLRFLKSFRR